MLGRTHLVFALLGGVLLYPYIGEDAFLFYVLISLGALLPDIDHQGSTVNRLLPVTRVFSFFFKHRGFFHSVFPALGLLALFWYMGKASWGIFLSVGYGMHLFSDALTVMGVRPFYPFLNATFTGFIKTGTYRETFFYAMLWAAVIAWFTLG